MAIMLLCKDCKYYESVRLLNNFCNSPEIRRINLVTGEVKRNYCDTQRYWDDNPNACGSKAQFFKPKE